MVEQANSVRQVRRQCGRAPRFSLPALAASALALALAAAGPLPAQRAVYGVVGTAPQAAAGQAVAGAGDVDRDGVADWLVGSPGEDGATAANAGVVRVYSGRTGLIIRRLDGGQTGARFGAAVAGAGDLNGDGFADILVGAPAHTSGGLTGRGFVFAFSGINSNMLWSQGGAAAGDALGTAVAGAGDVDNDGRADVIIGAPKEDVGAADVGSAEVYSGRTLARLHRLTGRGAGALFGAAVDGAGDLNGDGHADLIVGSPTDSSLGLGRGSAQVFSGIDGSPLFSIEGRQNGDNLGTSVAGPGDVNRDGVPDVIVGAPGEDFAAPNAGAASVHSGVDGSRLHVVDGEAAQDHLGTAVGGAGDVNGDGGADLLVGAPGNDRGGAEAGALHVLSGSTAVVLATALGLAAGDRLGTSAGGVGDLDSDGRAEFVVGAPGQAIAGAGSGGALVFGLVELLRDVVVHDLDGDGDAEITTVSEAANAVLVRLNDGIGGFSGPAVRIPLPAGHTGPSALVAGDLDADGAADDLAVTCRGSSSLVLVTDALAPTRARTAVGTLGLGPSHIAAGQLDAVPGDDLVIACEGSVLSGGAGIEIWRAGAPPTSLVLPPGVPVRVARCAVADLDGDGKQDVVALGQGAPDQLLLFAGDGAGGAVFAGGLPLPSFGFSGGLSCRDLDGDSRPELVVGAFVLVPMPTQTLEVFRYTGSGALDPIDYTANPSLAVSGAVSFDVACGDLEGDGKLEVAMANAAAPEVVLHLGYDPGSRAFANVVRAPCGLGAMAVELADVNGDGSDDVVVASQGTDDVTVLLSRRSGQTELSGTGCPSVTASVPAIFAQGAPVVGNRDFGVGVSATVTAPGVALLLVGGAPLGVPIGGGCTLYVAPPLITLPAATSPAGQALIRLPVPKQPTFVGADLFFQWFVADASGTGAFRGIGGFTQLLRVRLGNG